MQNLDKIYEKLIEVAEDVSGLRSSYEEGRENSKEAWLQNERDHKSIVESLSRKVDRAEISFFLWAQSNPRFMIWTAIVFGAGLIALTFDRTLAEREILKAVMK